MKKEKKWIGYAVHLSNLILVEMHDPVSPIYINKISDEDGYDDFLHALTNVAPAAILNEIDGQVVNGEEEPFDGIALNHLANRLIMKFVEFTDKSV